MPRAMAFGAGAFLSITVLNLSTRDWDGVGGVWTHALESTATALIVALLIGAGALLGFGSINAPRTSIRAAVIGGGISGPVLSVALELLARHFAAFHGPIVVAAYVIGSGLIAAAIGGTSRSGQPHG